MAKCVYRYNDWNRTGDGHAEIVLTKRIVIKETACFMWHIYSPYGIDPETYEPNDQEKALATKSHWKGQVIKSRKDAERSAWNETPEKALDSWRRRKGYQLKRLEIALERVQLCIKAHDANSPWNVTPKVIDAGSGPVLEQYNWGEYY